MQLLVEVLEKQVTGYKELLQLAQEKQGFLITNDITGLDTLNKKEGKLLVELTKLETQRIQIIQGLQDLLGNNASTMTLKELATSVPQPYQSKLQTIFQELHDIIHQLDKVNIENSGLIQQALKFVNSTIDMLAKEEREVTYLQSKDTHKQSRIFDQKA